jgi:glycosyltransferase involved in cell wall biosynthesis
VPTGIDTLRFARPTRPRPKRRRPRPAARHLGIVATLRSWKGHLFLLDAFAQLARPDLRLVIVGEGPMRGPIEEKIAALGLGDRVILAGQRTDPERWLQALDVFCLPSYANEGVPQAILQAMLCALPIVTTPVGAILEAVTDQRQRAGGRPKDANALATPPSAACSTTQRSLPPWRRSAPCRQRRLCKRCNARQNGKHFLPGRD